MKYNLNRTQFEVAMRQIGLGKLTKNEATREMIPIVAWSLMVPGLISGAIAFILAGAHDDDEDKYLVGLAKKSLGGVVSESLPMVGPFSSLATAAAGQFTDAQWDDQISLSPVVGTAGQAVQFPEALYDAMFNEGSKKKALRTGLSFTTVVSSAAGHGLPVEFIGKPAGYLLDIQEGDKRPTGPIDFTRGLITGK